MPFGRKDQLAGYWWECSMRQVEVSRTIVLDAPRRLIHFQHDRPRWSAFWDKRQCV
jgi:hypothetical protein